MELESGRRAERKSSTSSHAHLRRRHRRLRPPPLSRLAPGLRRRLPARPAGAHARDRARRPTRLPNGTEVPNEPVRVYDTSGPWGDPDFHGDATQRAAPDPRGLDPRARRRRGGRGPRRPADRRRLPLGKPPRPGRGRGPPQSDQVFRPRRPRTVLRAKPGQRVSQLHYAREGKITPEMEYIAIRENTKLQRARELLEMTADGPRNSLWRQHPGPEPGAPAIPREITPGVRARRGRPRPRDHPLQHQPPGARADDHRPQLPGEDQHQHRQLRRRLLDRRGGREDALVGEMGRRHADGPLHRPEHPPDPRVDPAQLPGAGRHRADLPGAGEGRRPPRGR